MGIFNQHSDNQPQQQRFLRGLQGSPGVGFSLTQDGNYDMNNKKLKNVGEGVESSDAVTKHQLETAINSKINTSPSLSNYVKKDSPEVAADLDMKGYAIKNMKVTPGGDASATSRKYVDRKLGTKADRNDLNGYLKLDGTNQITPGPNAPKIDHLDKLCFSCIFLHKTWQMPLDCCPICLNLKIDTKCEIMTS